MEENKLFKSRKRLEVSVFGYIRAIKVAGVSDKAVEDAYNRAYNGIAQTVYIDYVLADMVLILFKDFLVKKKLYKMGMKKLLNETQSNLRRCMGIMEPTLAKELLNEMSCNHYDNVKDDMKKLREMFTAKLVNLGVKNAGLCGWLILVQNFVLLSMEHFQMVLDGNYKLTGIDLSGIFDMIEARGAWKSASEMLRIGMGADLCKYNRNIVENKEIGEQFKRILAKMFTKESFRKAADSAYNELSEDDKQRWSVIGKELGNKRNGK